MTSILLWYNSQSFREIALIISEKLYVYPCEWNLRPDHCMYGLTCDSANMNGASILHGNREVFHNEKQPAFKAVYEAFVQVAL